MDLREKEGDSNETLWQVPYLSIDPRDIGRTYEEIIRINSQSGKGGVAYVLSREFGLDLPKAMHPEVGLLVNEKADSESRELAADEIYATFKAEYLEKNSPLELLSYNTGKEPGKEEVSCSAKVRISGEEKEVSGRGNGPINAFVNALEGIGLKDFKLIDYRQHSIGRLGHRIRRLRATADRGGPGGLRVRNRLEHREKRSAGPGQRLQPNEVTLSGSTPSSSANSLEGVLERITFYNEENGFLIGKLKGSDKNAEIAVVGKAPKVQCGETLALTGKWVNHPKHGRQFSFDSFESKLPASAYGIRKYLASGLIHGIGKTYANKIVDKFGADTLRVISEESARLREIEGIGQKRVKSIKEAWEEQKAVREVMMFLQTYGVTDALCLALVRKYGNSPKRSSNPTPTGSFGRSRESDSRPQTGSP